MEMELLEDEPVMTIRIKISLRLIIQWRELRCMSIIRPFTSQRLTPTPDPNEPSAGIYITTDRYYIDW